MTSRHEELVLIILVLSFTDELDSFLNIKLYKKSYKSSVLVFNKCVKSVKLLYSIVFFSTLSRFPLESQLDAFLVVLDLSSRVLPRRPSDFA